jgi:hypothetical protein
MYYVFIITSIFCIAADGIFITFPRCNGKPPMANNLLPVSDKDDVKWDVPTEKNISSALNPHHLAMLFM